MAVQVFSDHGTAGEFDVTVESRVSATTIPVTVPEPLPSTVGAVRATQDAGDDEFLQFSERSFRSWVIENPRRLLRILREGEGDPAFASTVFSWLGESADRFRELLEGACSDPALCAILVEVARARLPQSMTGPVEVTFTARLDPVAMNGNGHASEPLQVGTTSGSTIH